MKKIIFILILLVSYSYHIFSQVDTSRIEFKENPMLRGVHHIIIEHENIEIIELNDPAGPIQPIDDPPINENCTLKRLVFFVHGLGGSNTSWERAATAMMLPSHQGQNFKARYCETFRLSYSPTITDLTGAAIDIRQQIITHSNNYQSPSGSIPGFYPDPSLNFIIAHSQGGVVARALMENDLMTTGKYGYGGLVTIASPLQGAMILTHKNCLMAFIQDACESMLAGPIAENLTSTNPFLDQILLGFGKEVVSMACNTATNLVPEIMKEFNSQATNQYTTGANFISQLNAGAHTDAQSANPINRYMPKVAFYGVEPPDNLIWRTLLWMVNNPNSPDPWQANDDFALLDNNVIPLKNHYFLNVTSHRDQAEALAKKKFFLTAYHAYQNFQQQISHHIKAHKWSEGVQWLNGANISWLGIIGAWGEVPVGQACMCDCWISGAHVSMMAPDCNTCAQYCGPNLFATSPITLISWKFKESDGIVLAESAQDLPYATQLPVRLRGIETDPQNWTGSSHMQIRNDEALRDNLTKLLDGDYGDFFKLTKQQP